MKVLDSNRTEALGLVWDHLQYGVSGSLSDKTAQNIDEHWLCEINFLVVEN